jgi:hypothetical protein
MSDSEQSTPVGLISHSRPRTVVEIEKMSSDLLELVDQFDANACELRRKDIPLKISWQTNRANATARLEKMVALHDRASTEQLNLDLGDSDDTAPNAARIRRLYTEVDSLAALLSTGMEALKADIVAMVAAAAAGAAGAAGAALFMCQPPARESAHPAESAPAWAARQLQNNPHLAPALDDQLLQRQTERMANAALRLADSSTGGAALRLEAAAAEAAALNPAAPRHRAEDCVATTADFSDWKLTTRLIDELVP